ncbi:hypothetical protein GGH19_005317 [Coemansia sp. RSA 1807]|nr:hypothetical protein GGH19_005317 [Coemansia sp. RSA 1807]
MADIGTFDTLPYHMVKQTIDYVVEQTNEIDMFDFDEENNNVFYPLLHVCRSWRTVALSVMLTGCDVTLDKEVKFAYHTVKEHTCITNTINNSYNMHVITVHLSINFSSVLDGSVAAQLEAEATKHIAFPKAYALRVQLTIEDVHGPTTDYVQNVDRTLACLANMIPAITKVTVITKDYDLPFRGNRNSLLKLGLNISPRVIRLMNEFPVSTSISERKFEKLLLADESEAPEIPENNVSTYTEFINMHLPTVKYLFLQGQGISSLLHSPLYSTAQYANITQVSLIIGSHSFAQITRILRLCPELKKLVSRISSMGDEFKDMSIQEIYCHLKSNSFPRHLHLQTWNSQFLEGISPTVTCDTILLLANMCPYLKNITFNVENCESLENVYSKIAYSGTYNKFREQMNPRVEFSLEQFNKSYYVRIQRRHIA